MSRKPNNFSPEMVKKIREVGRKIEYARLAKRLSIHAAALATVAPSKSGHIDEQTWRRAERGALQLGGVEVVYRANPTTFMAIAEVIGLDGAELCRAVDLVPPPPRSIDAMSTARERGREERSLDDPDGVEIRNLRRKVWELEDRLERLEKKDGR